MLSKTPRFLTAKQVGRLYKTFIATLEPTQPALLESAVQSPINIKHYTKEDNLFVLAANLSTKIMMNHAFPDGNKRGALIAADMFLKMNGYQLQRTPVEHGVKIEQAQVNVVTGVWSVEDLAKFYSSIATEMDDD